MSTKNSADVVQLGAAPTQMEEPMGIGGVIKTLNEFDTSRAAFMALHPNVKEGDILPRPGVRTAIIEMTEREIECFAEFALYFAAGKADNEFRGRNKGRFGERDGLIDEHRHRDFSISTPANL